MRATKSGDFTIDYTNQTIIPKEHYSLFIDVRHNLERLGLMLNKDCVKIFYFDTAHIVYQNAAESNRLLQVQERRGVTLLSRRYERPNYGVEFADYIMGLGNEFTVNTYKYIKKKLFTIPDPCCVIKFDYPRRDWNLCKNRFVWFSNYGLVHKGLHLALEAFVEVQDCHLTVCGPIEREKDFVDAYYKELYETPNIETIGWADVESDRFKEIIGECSGMLHLSCSEGSAGAVKICMHGGLIPIVSYESGVDVNDFGFLLKRLFSE